MGGRLMNAALYAKAHRAGALGARVLATALLGSLGLLCDHYHLTAASTFFMCCAACCLWK